MTETNEPTDSTRDTIPVEWNWDMDTTTVSLDVWGGQPPFSKFAAKGRCKRCWGSLRGRTDPVGAVTGIRCVVCGKLLEGNAAAAEAQRISEESFFNALNMMAGRQPEYGDGLFAQKVFPKVDRLSEEELRDRVALSKSQYSKSPKGKLTRHEFPAGAPGWFFLQARALLDGVSGITDHDRDSIADFPDYRVNTDGSVTVRIDAHALSQNPRHREQELLATAGLLLGNGMIAAFACELALKAISLTCTDEASKTHDLLELFDNLPGDSRGRLEADFSTMRDVLTEHRGSFGTWRYFEADVGTDAFKAIAGPRPTQLLAKAGRVILDEAEYVGLTGSTTVQASRQVRVTERQREKLKKIRVTIKGGECPPRR